MRIDNKGACSTLYIDSMIWQGAEKHNFGLIFCFFFIKEKEGRKAKITRFEITGLGVRTDNLNQYFTFDHP